MQIVQERFGITLEVISEPCLARGTRAVWPGQFAWPFPWARSGGDRVSSGCGMFSGPCRFANGVLFK